MEFKCGYFEFKNVFTEYRLASCRRFLHLPVYHLLAIRCCVNFAGDGLTGSLPRDLTVNLETAQLAATPITAMIFDNNSGITGTLARDFGYMAKMKTFSATETGLSSTLPETWSAMAGLQVLRLSNTPVTGTIPASWSSLTHLTTVVLDNTALSGTLPASRSTLTSLQVLLVNNTQVDGGLPLECCNLTSHVRFNATGTKLSGTIPQSWSAMKSLQTVSLAGTNITGCMSASCTDILELNATNVGLSEMAACSKTSKHKPWKFLWWAVLISVFSGCAVIVRVVIAVLRRRSLLPCQKRSEADSVSSPSESVPQSGAGVDSNRRTPRATVNRNASTARSGCEYAPHTAQSSSEVTSPANFAVGASSSNDDMSTTFVEQNASSRRVRVLNEARRFIIIVDGERHTTCPWLKRISTEMVMMTVRLPHVTLLMPKTVWLDAPCRATFRFYLKVARTQHIIQPPFRRPHHMAHNLSEIRCDLRGPHYPLK